MSMLELLDTNDEFFGDHVFSVRHLMQWLDAKGLALPIQPGITEHLFVQVCALLCEIQSYAYESISHEKSVSIVRRQMRENDRFHAPIARVKISCDVAAQWRSMLVEAVGEGELTLLNYASKLPVIVARASEDRVSTDVVHDRSGSGHDWKEKAWGLAAIIRNANLERGWGYDKLTVAAEIEKMFGPDKLNLRTKTGKTIDRNYIVRYALSGWSKRFGSSGK
jgi:hypothetical protein